MDWGGGRRAPSRRDGGSEGGEEVDRGGGGGGGHWNHLESMKTDGLPLAADKFIIGA